MPLKVLILTYYWPPSGGAGVQRWVKFAKYLPGFGIEPVILTVDNEYAAYPVTDPSLAAEIPPSLKVYATPARNYFSLYSRDKSKIPSAGFAINNDDSLKGKLMRFIRGNFFIPDPRRGWNSFAFAKACQLIRNEGISHVITTSPPHSTQLIGLKLKKKFPGIKWTADLRDPWTDIYYYENFYPTFISKFIDSNYEKQVIGAADSVITVGNSLVNLFARKAQGADRKITVIPNGYDPEDFSHDAGNPTETITYAGTLSDAYPVDGFIRAVAGMGRKDINLRFVGSVSGKNKNVILSGVPAENVHFMSYAEHAAAIKHMRTSSALLLVIPDHPSNRSILTGKLFEYLATGKPIICVGPTDGDAAEIIRETGNGRTFAYNDSESMKEYLNLIFSGQVGPKSAPLRFSRRELSGKLASIITENESRDNSR